MATTYFETREGLVKRATTPAGEVKLKARGAQKLDPVEGARRYADQLEHLSHTADHKAAPAESDDVTKHEELTEKLLGRKPQTGGPTVPVTIVPASGEEDQS